MKLICCCDEGVIEINNVRLELYGNWYDIDTLARTMYIQSEVEKIFYLNKIEVDLLPMTS